MKCLVSHQGQESGPFALAEIVAKVRAKELELFDYIYDESKSDWVLLMEHADLAQQLKSNKPPRPPQTATVVEAPAATSEAPKAGKKPQGAPVITGQSPHLISEWFILKGEHKFGPFGYNDVIRMLQQKVVFPFDFVWHAGLQDWKRVADLNEFHPESIRRIYSTGDKSVFTERKFKRTKYEGRVIIHDNLTLWKGQGFEISRGGLGVRMKNALVVPGQQLFVHFSGHEGFPAMNAVCEVVSKKYVNDNSPVEYGLRFLSLSQDAQDEFYKKVA